MITEEVEEVEKFPLRPHCRWQSVILVPRYYYYLKCILLHPGNNHRPPSTQCPDSAPDKYNTSNALGKSQINTTKREIKFYGSYNSTALSVPRNRTGPNDPSSRRKDAVMKRTRFRAPSTPPFIMCPHWKWLFNDSYFFPMVSLNK